MTSKSQTLKKPGVNVAFYEFFFTITERNVEEEIC